MKITIITVVYNNELIRSAIMSVANQTYKNIEYIIVDGGSNDGTLEIIKSFGNVVNCLISEPDKGIYDAINKGIKLATGDVIGILNSDDILADNNVIDRVAANFNHSHIEAVYSDVKFVQRNDVTKVIRYYNSGYFKPWMFRFGFQPAHPTFYARKGVFEKYGLYNIDFKIAGDFELLLRTIGRAKIKTNYVKDVWVKMRVGGVSTSGMNSIIVLNDEIVRACKANKLYTNLLFVYSKYGIKWWSFLIKKS